MKKLFDVAHQNLVEDLKTDRVRNNLGVVTEDLEFYLDQLESRQHVMTKVDVEFQAANLKRHLITHTGEKLHKCAQCSKSFGHAASLKTHLITVARRSRNVLNAINCFTELLI